MLTWHRISNLLEYPSKVCWEIFLEPTVPLNHSFSTQSGGTVLLYYDDQQPLIYLRAINASITLVKPSSRASPTTLILDTGDRYVSLPDLSPLVLTDAC